MLHENYVYIGPKDIYLFVFRPSKWNKFYVFMLYHTMRKKSALKKKKEGKLLGWSLNNLMQLWALIFFFFFFFVVVGMLLNY